jgi:hypothetical protein
MDRTPPTWRKSSKSTTDGECVEVAWPGPAVGVRDSKNSAGANLAVAHAAWNELLVSIKTGELTR